MDRRVFFRQGLSTLYLPYYDGLCGLLSQEWQPFFGCRSFQEQERLYKQGRELPGPVVTKAKPGESAHNYGCGTDWTIFEGVNPLWFQYDDPRWSEYQNACEKMGLRWGADWNCNGNVHDESFHDAPHNELRLACDWKHIAVTYQQGGMTAAQQHIERNLIK